ncbi:MAG: ATP-binding cassette domain-containing protein [Cytophagaceae bacterium]
MSHIAIYFSESDNKNQLLDDLLDSKYLKELEGLQHKKVVIFSSYTLMKFLNEEHIRDSIDMIPKGERKLSTYSEGEQKKKLFYYLLSLQPECLVIDNVLDNLDVKVREEFVQHINSIKDTVSILQLFTKQEEVLSFITTSYSFHQGGLVPYTYSKKEIKSQTVQVPQPLKKLVLQSIPLVQFKDVVVQYEDRIVQPNVTWTVNSGEFWLLKGPNGSGKTSLLTMIIGDNPKAFGQDITLFGKKKGSGESVWEIKQKIGYFTKSMILYYSGSHTVEEIIISGFLDTVGLYDKPTSHHKSVAMEWLKCIGLENEKDTPFRFLTNAQKQILLVTRALVKHPALIILDEPTVGLNDEQASLVTALINTFAEQKNSAIIYVSHRIDPGLNPRFIYELKRDG